MKLNTPIEINFLEFFKTGKFDFIKLGKTKEWILHNFPDPDGFAESERKAFLYQYNIWRYGNIEFHFADQALHMIFSDYINVLNGGPHLQLDKWILEKPKKLTLPFVIDQLIREGIDFVKQTYKDFGNIQLKLLKSKVTLYFGNTEEEIIDKIEPKDFMLYGFSLAIKNF